MMKRCSLIKKKKFTLSKLTHVPVTKHGKILTLLGTTSQLTSTQMMITPTFLKKTTSHSTQQMSINKTLKIERLLSIKMKLLSSKSSNTWRTHPMALQKTAIKPLKSRMESTNKTILVLKTDSRELISSLNRQRSIKEWLFKWRKSQKLSISTPKNVLWSLMKLKLK